MSNLYPIFIEIIGLMGMILAVGGNIPQVAKTFKDKNVSSFSLWFLVTWASGCFLNVVYICLTDFRLPLFLTNFLNLLFPVALLIFYSKYKK